MPLELVSNKGRPKRASVRNDDNGYQEVQDSVELNFVREPKKSKRQLKKLIEVVRHFTRTREDVLKSLRPDEDPVQTDRTPAEV